MSDFDALLPRPLPRRRRRRRLTLVVIAPRERDVASLEISQSRWRRARVIALVGRSAEDLETDLAALRKVHVVVDVRPATGSGQRDTFERCFFLVARRGAWVALRSSGRIPRREPLAMLAGELSAPPPKRHLPHRWRDHARASTRIQVTPGAVVVGKRRAHLLGLRSDQVPDLLVRREPGLQVTELSRLPGGSLDARGRLHDHGAEPRVPVPEVLAYPEHVLRRYRGGVHLPAGPLAYHRRTVLPESYRWHLAPRLRVNGTDTVGEHFARLRAPRPTERLDGSYFHFVYANPGHFGHLMTEAVSRLWGWDAAKAADPELKVLCRRRLSTGLEGPEEVLLPAYGVDPADIEWIDAGVSVESLVTATPMWHNAQPFYAHPAVRDAWTRLRTGLIGTDPVASEPHIFVTRRTHNRLCRNFEEVEQFFADRGFTIVVPEELTIPDQARTFAGARVIAGFAGAGMFNLTYADALETVIVLSQSAYHARNEHLYAAVLGADLHTFWSAPDLDHPPDRLHYRAHQSSWSFDVEAHGRALDLLLGRLVQ